MAYYGAPPGAYGGPPSFPPGGAPPGFGAPPGMPAGSPTAMQTQFQPPPGFNWTAPTIRLGVDGPQPAQDDRRNAAGRGSNAEPLGNRNRLGLGASRDDRGLRDYGGDRGGGGRDRDIERERAALRESMQALQPPTREEVARTIFVGGLGEGVPGEEAIEDILRCAGKLRRWVRARDADDRVCKFGFAEYEDVDSLEAANEIFSGGVEVPVVGKNGAVVRDDDGEAKMMKLLVVVDEQSRKYIDEWKGRGREDADARQFRLDGCKEDLRQCITGIINASAYAAKAEVTNGANGDGDTVMTNGEADYSNQPATLPGLEDELSDIPTEMRATVAAEIKAFRDRSTRRDVERLRREEEMEQAERNRSRPGPARASPPPPSGPRGAQAVQGAPAGPKAYRGAQLPSDYVNGVSFVGANGATNGFNREDEDAEESDEELERRRQAKKDEQLQRQYADAERKWLNRERQRSAALAREKEREEVDDKRRGKEKALIAQRLAEWDDREEEAAAREEYYYDRSSWLRKRAIYREREGREDERDRAAEDAERRKDAEARGLADDFLDRTAAELQQRGTGSVPTAAAAQGFKISLGSAAAKQRAAAPAASAMTAAAPRRGLADIEGLLEDEEDAAANASTKRPALKPLTDLSTAPHPSDLTDEERTSMRQALAAEIPTDTAGLFATPLNYRYLTPSVIEQEIRPFVAKKVVEYLGVQEDLIVDSVVQGLKERKRAEELVGELEPAMEEEAEVLVRKVWRLGVFWGEGGARGLN